MYTTLSFNLLNSKVKHSYMFIRKLQQRSTGFAPGDSTKIRGVISGESLNDLGRNGLGLNVLLADFDPHEFLHGWNDLVRAHAAQNEHKLKAL